MAEETEPGAFLHLHWLCLPLSSVPSDPAHGWPPHPLHCYPHLSQVGEEGELSVYLHTSTGGIPMGEDSAPCPYTERTAIKASLGFIALVSKFSPGHSAGTHWKCAEELAGRTGLHFPISKMESQHSVLCFHWKLGVMAEVGEGRGKGAMLFTGMCVTSVWQF